MDFTGWSIEDIGAVAAYMDSIDAEMAARIADEKEEAQDAIERSRGWG